MSDMPAQTSEVHGVLVGHDLERSHARDLGGRSGEVRSRHRPVWRPHWRNRSNGRSADACVAHVTSVRWARAGLYDSWRTTSGPCCSANDQLLLAGCGRSCFLLVAPTTRALI